LSAGAKVILSGKASVLLAQRRADTTRLFTGKQKFVKDDITLAGKAGFIKMFFRLSDFRNA